MTIVSPVIQLAASETRKATAEAMSAGSPMRPSATEADTSSSSLCNVHGNPLR